MGERYKSFGMLGKKQPKSFAIKMRKKLGGKKRPPFSAEWKENMSKAMKGKVAWNKGKKYGAISGSKHWNWQGGITKEHLLERASLKCKLWREKVFKRDNFTCQMCGQIGGKLQADHIKSFSKFPKLRYRINNGRTLCFGCHKLTDNYCGKAFAKPKCSKF